MGAATIVTQNLWFPNGMMITDGTLIVAETFATPLTALRHPARRIAGRPARAGPGRPTRKRCSPR
jgi:hypothetical protein